MTQMPGRAILAARWLLAVFFFGLVAGLGLYAVRFLMKLGALAGSLTSMPEEDFLIALLHLVDAALVASLVVIVALASYDSLVDRLHRGAEASGMRWVTRTEYGNLKIKVATAMVAISSIHLLQVFLKIESYANEAVMWRIAIHLTFLGGAVLLGVLDRLGRHGGAAEKNEAV